MQRGTDPSGSEAYGRSLSGNAGSNPAGVMDVSVMSFVFCQVEVSATDRVIVQISPSECNRETS
jgi:hypothetical protein